ncbi:MAG: hypothetical protein WC955_07035 [Elusimicrobiota bacterium]
MMSLVIGLVFIILGAGLLLIPGAAINLWVVISGVIPVCLIIGGLFGVIIGLSALRESFIEKEEDSKVEPEQKTEATETGKGSTDVKK